MSKNIDLSVIIVALRPDNLIQCLESLKPALRNVSHEIIVIDNAPKEKIIYPGIKIIKNETKAGFGQNNNIGLGLATGRYLLLLNDDTIIINNSIFSEMITWMDTHTKAGISSCALKNPDQKTLQKSGGYFPTLFKVFAWMFFIDDIPLVGRLIKSYHPHLDYFKNVHEQDWVTGAFFLMRKEAFEEVGYFDEDFFLYVEEVDLSYRFKEKGWQIWYLPNWSIVHYGSATTGTENAVIMEMRNLKLFYKKHFSKWQLPILTAILKIGALLRILVFGKVYAKAFKSI